MLGGSIREFVGNHTVRHGRGDIDNRTAPQISSSVTRQRDGKGLLLLRDLGHGPADEKGALGIDIQNSVIVYFSGLVEWNVLCGVDLAGRPLLQ